jgi:hypothetical protein
MKHINITWDYWVYEPYPSSNSLKNTLSETGSVLVLKQKREGTNYVGSPDNLCQYKCNYICTWGFVGWRHRKVYRNCTPELKSYTRIYPWGVLSDHTELPSKFLTSLIRRIHMGEISKLVWLIRFIKYAIWSNSVYFPYLLLLWISKILASSHPTLWPSS